MSAALENKVFFKYVRAAKLVNFGVASGLRNVTWETLKRVGAKRDPAAAYAGMPKGSDQFNEGDIVRWLRGIDPTDEEAVRQLVILDATLTKRVTG